MKFDPATLAEPITKVYEEITDQVLANLAGHFNFQSLDSASAQWQIKKLAETWETGKGNYSHKLPRRPNRTGK